MKKLLLLACLPYTIFAMDKRKASDQLIKFITMEQGHKQDWLDHKKMQYDAKIDMLEKHLNQMFDLKKKYIDELATGKDIQAFFGEKLKTLVKMHEEQAGEWKELCESMHNKGQDIVQAHKKELEVFKKSAFPAVKEVKEVKEAKELEVQDE